MATICMHHVDSSLAAIGDQPQVRNRLLTSAGINPQVIALEHRRISTDQVARLFSNVQLELSDEFMGFAGTPCRLGTFSLVCELVRHCHTLEELLRKSAEAYRVIYGDVIMRLEESRGRARFVITHHREDKDNVHFLREFLLVIWHRFPSWYIGEAIHLLETHFTFARPKHHSELKIMFPGRLKYSAQDNQLVFDASYLRKPLIRTTAELEAFVIDSPAGVMTIPGIDDSLERRIRRLVVTSSGAGLEFPRVDEVAAQFGVSTQTLYRQLKAIGTSYQKIKEDIRRESAIRYLTVEKLSVEQVSDRVGFGEARSFTRAFQQWTGMSPSKYRKLARQVSQP